MTVTNPGPTPHLDTASRPDGNASDIHYLEEASAALLPIMAACDAAAARSSRQDVRALARDALSVQTQQLSAIAEVLRAWGRTDVVRLRTTNADALVGLHGAGLDRVFLERLTAHAHASINGARAEMVAGASRSARPIAEHAIHVQCRQVAALARLVRTTAEASEADKV
jgi:uncharacterized protein (DUF305 family)